MEPLLRAFGKNVFHLGESGNGTLTKLVNNAIFLCGGLLLQESFALAAKAGLDPNRLLEVVQASCGAAYAGMAKLLLGRGFDNAFFQLALAEKDVGARAGLGARPRRAHARHRGRARHLRACARDGARREALRRDAARDRGRRGRRGAAAHELRLSDQYCSCRRV